MNRTQEILQRIADENNGILHPRDVVMNAQNPEHPLHHHFEWDDTKAAAEHRLSQARALIASVKIEVVNMPTVRAWVSVPDLRVTTGGYESTLSVMRDQQRGQLVLEEILGRIDRLTNEHQALSDLQPIRDAVKTIRSTQKTRENHENRTNYQ